jgi:hypothetical protein
MASTTSSSQANHNHIDKLDFPPKRGEQQPLLHDRPEPSPGPSHETSRSGSFFEQVAEGIQERDRAKMKQVVLRYGSFAAAILSWCVDTSDHVQT